MTTSLIIGATSSLAHALAHSLADNGHALILAARDEEEMQRLASDLSVRYGTEASCVPLDLSTAENTLKSNIKTMSHADNIFFLAGDMGTENPLDETGISATYDINLTKPAFLLTLLAKEMQQKKQGAIVIVSSVAGDRGRQSNYIYGSAKAGLTAFASGLRNKLYPDGIHVMTVKPGFLDTPMTYFMQSPLIYDRTKAAEAIITALEKRRDSIYVPFFWSHIMWIIKTIPERVFKTLRL